MNLPALALLVSLAWVQAASGTEGTAASDVGAGSSGAPGQEEPVMKAVVPPAVEPVLDLEIRSKRDAALVIGNEDYARLPDAPYAERGAEAFRDLLRETVGVPHYRFRFRTGASRREIERDMRRIVYRARRGGTLWIYFSGHGYALGPGGEPAILPDDTPADPARLEKYAVPLSKIAEVCQRTKADHVVVILDAGFDGLGRAGEPLFEEGERPERVASMPQDDPRIVYWAADDGGAWPTAWDSVQHGTFTWAVMGAMRGWADGALGEEPDRTVSVAEAQLWVRTTLARLGKRQRPTLDLRPEVARWYLTNGNLDPSPPPMVFTTLAQQAWQARIDETRTALRSQVEEDWALLQQRVEQGDETAVDLLKIFLEIYERPVLSVEWVEHVPEADEARRLLLTREDWIVPEPVAEAGGESVAGSEDEGAEGDTGTAEDTASPVDDSCDDLRALEDEALAGELRPAQVACLEQRIEDAELQTTKDKVSRLLLVDAEGKGDGERWEDLVQRHLDQIDQSDPDLCFKYAVYLSRQGIERAAEVLRWAGRALENKDDWHGRAYEKKVYLLFRIQTEAATELWNQAEERYLEARSEQAKDVADEYRGRAKEYAKAWLDYARLTGQDDSTALSMCLSAAGAMEYCLEK